MHDRPTVRAPRPVNDAVLLHVLDSEVTRRTLSDYLGNDVTLVTSLGDRMYKRARVVALGPGSWPDPPEGKRLPRAGARREPIPLEVGQMIIFRDWLTRWHTGSGTWPGEGDLALVRWRHRRSDGRKPDERDEHPIACVVEDSGAWIDWPRQASAVDDFGAEAFRTDALGVDPGRWS